MKRNRQAGTKVERPATSERVRQARLREPMQVWIGTTLVRALTLKANEVCYERGRDGLTVEFRNGSELLEAVGPVRRYADRVIPRLNRMGQQGLPKRLKGETGRFLTAWNGREWSSPIFYTRTKSGERVVVRFMTPRPCAG